MKLLSGKPEQEVGNFAQLLETSHSYAESRKRYSASRKWYSASRGQGACASCASCASGALGGFFTQSACFFGGGPFIF